MSASHYGLVADLERSHGAYVMDAATGLEYLDLFGLYASLPLGYNHPAFCSPSFLKGVLTHATVKLPVCEMDCPEAQAFRRAFRGHPSMAAFSDFAFCTTGALAIELAIKTALIDKGQGKVAVFKSNFHGITGYGARVAPRGGLTGDRLTRLPHGDLAYVLPDPDYHNWPIILDTLRFAAKHGALAAVLIEPIQCLAGDRVIPAMFLRELRALCTELDLPLIFDEVQTGFGGTGTLWYFEQLGLTPDIVAFGKKTQVSGIMVQPRWNDIFAEPNRLSSTWDGDVIDMMRCRVILETYDQLNILANVQARGQQLAEGIPGLRHVGLLCALDFDSYLRRDEFIKRMFGEERTIMISTGERSVRWRPNLAFTAAEANRAIGSTRCCMEMVAA